MVLTGNIEVEPEAEDIQASIIMDTIIIYQQAHVNIVKDSMITGIATNTIHLKKGDKD